MIDVKLTASDFELELYVDSYEFPGFNTGRDANALTCEIELDLKRQRLDLHAAHSLILYTFELAEFVFQAVGGRFAHDRLIQHVIVIAIVVDEFTQFGDAFAGLAFIH